MGTKDAILVGVGFAGTQHYLPTLAESKDFSIIGAVDPLDTARERANASCPGIWTVPTVQEIPDTAPRDTVVFVVTPDHYPVVVGLVESGFRNLVVEKPLVSRDDEVTELQELVVKHGLQIYAIDHYYQKFLPLQFVLGRMPITDPRVASITITGDHQLDELPHCLGVVEGVTYTNIEAGDLGVPYLNDHPWLENDPEIGGMIRDLGPHAFSPLVRNGLLGAPPDLFDIQLLGLSPNRTRYVPLLGESEIEMYVHALLTYKGVTANITFAKAPFQGKERSLAVRASNGTFFAGLARGQSSVVLTDDGRTTRLSLRVAENQLVIEEANLFFNGQLPGFDGNLEAAITALQLGQGIRTAYFNILR